MTVYKSVSISVYDAENDEEVVVAKDSEFDMVVVKAKSDYYGNLNFSMNPDTAVALAEAILEQVEYIREKA